MVHPFVNWAFGLNVIVEERLCQENHSSELCSGHGRCLMEVGARGTAVIVSLHSLGNTSRKWMNVLVNHVKLSGSGINTI